MLTCSSILLAVVLWMAVSFHKRFTLARRSGMQDALSMPALWSSPETAAFKPAQSDAAWMHPWQLVSLPCRCLTFLSLYLMFVLPVTRLGPESGCNQTVPFLSVALATQPQIFIWRSIVSIIMWERTLAAVLHYVLYRDVAVHGQITEFANKFRACAHMLELGGLVMFTYVSEGENSVMHQASFMLFACSALGCMWATCLLTWSWQSFAASDKNAAVGEDQQAEIEELA